MVEEKKPNESAVTAGDFSLKNKLKKLIRGKKAKSQPPKSVESHDTTSHSSLARRNIFKNKFVVVIFLIAVVGLGVYLYRDKLVEIIQKNNESEQTCQNPASEKCVLLKEGLGLFDPAQVQKLHDVVGKIKATKDYEQDPNLLYVLVTYDLNLSDAENARKDLNLLKNVYKPNVGYDPLLRNNAKTPKQLEEDVAFLERQNKYLKANFWGVTQQ